jgi:hypothetical protein
LQDCPSLAHVEQGSVLTIADGSGSSSSGPHLHFEKVDRAGASLPFNHSGITNFCDHTIAGFCTGDFGGQLFLSDNAGPGVNAQGNLFAWNAISQAYSSLGHYLCGANNAWQCFGSSLNLLGEGPMATRGCLGASGDCGWNQDFMQNGRLHNFNWPEACSHAFWVPDRFFTTWLANTWLG